MNWKRPVKLIKVKQYNYKIYIDKCCFKLVKLIDNLKNTYTIWCCCGHGLHSFGIIEFNSSLKLKELKKLTNRKIYRDTWRDKDNIKGYHINHKCNCNIKITNKAKKQFGGKNEPIS